MDNNNIVEKQHFIFLHLNFRTIMTFLLIMFMTLSEYICTHCLMPDAVIKHG